MDQKSSSITILINLILPGAGHLYASGGKEGVVLLVIYVICLGLTPVIYIPVVGALTVWIIAMVKSGEVTEKYNSRLRAAECKRMEAAKANESERVVAAEEAAARLTGKTLAQQFTKLHMLADTGILNAEEAASEKRKVMAEALNHWTDQDIVDFLSPFAMLVQDGTMSSTELEQIKKVYASIVRI